jgi:ABC-2 type transport system ATP-binding protein
LIPNSLVVFVNTPHFAVPAPSFKSHSYKSTFFMSIIELRGLCKRYARNTALDNVDITVESGITGLLGPNGSGKSTLIKSLLGLVRVDAGSGRVLGEDWPRTVRQIRDRIGYLPEEDCYIAGLQGVESVQMMAQLSGLQRGEALRRAHEVLDFCDVGQERYRKVETYSTGMRQKLKCAQALVHDPELIILDEPTTGLDPTQREEFLQRLKALAQRHGKSIMLSTHILHDVKQICDRVIILIGGRVRVAETLEVLSRPSKPGLHLMVIDGAQRLVDLLTQHHISASCADDGQRVFVEGVTAERSSEIWNLCARHEIYLQRLEPARNSLEQTFLDAVQEVQRAVA